MTLYDRTLDQLARHLFANPPTIRSEGTMFRVAWPIGIVRTFPNEDSARAHIIYVRDAMLFSGHDQRSASSHRV